MEIFVIRVCFLSSVLRAKRKGVVLLLIEVKAREIVKLNRINLIVFV